MGPVFFNTFKKTKRELEMDAKAERRRASAAQMPPTRLALARRRLDTVVRRARPTVVQAPDTPSSAAAAGSPSPPPPTPAPAASTGRRATDTDDESDFEFDVDDGDSSDAFRC